MVFIFKIIGFIIGLVTVFQKGSSSEEIAAGFLVIPELIRDFVELLIEQI